MVFAELWAEQETRLERNAHPDRIEAKPSKRDVADSNRVLVQHDEEYRLTSKGHAFPLAEPHLLLDNTDLGPAEAAERIARHFGLPRKE